MATLTEGQQMMIVDAACHAEQMRMGLLQEEAYERCRPSTIHKPRIFIDGNMWCALYGESIVEGVAGFGASPSEAFEAFDKAWVARVPQRVEDVPKRRATGQGDLQSVLEEVAEELEKHFDTVDGDEGTPSPNWAMKLHQRIEEALGRGP